MNDIVFSDIEFKDNLFEKFNSEIEKNSEKLSFIAKGGINKGDVYQRAIRKFTDILPIGIGENNKFTWNEILYITNELSISKYMFNNLLEYEEFESFILVIKQYEKLSVYKKVFKIYFNYYSTLSQDKSIDLFKMYLKSIIRNYKGNNKYLNNIVLMKDYIFGDLPSLLDTYNDDFEKINQDFNLEPQYEFTKSLLNLKIIKELKSLDYDEENSDIFSTIIKRKDMFFSDGLSLKEYIAKYMIDTAFEEKKPFPNWQLFILQLIGDPRSISMYASNMGSWNVIGERNKEYFIKTLSQDDLKIFLEVLSDSVSDTNYHYRKSFWMQFLDKVIFTKIMIGEDAYNTMNDVMKEKFKISNESYSMLTGNHSQSAIYIDFGSIKVIEFTHNGSLRFFTDCPIDIHQRKFSLSQMTPIKFIKKRLAHSGAKTYHWQQHALNIMNQSLNSNVKVEDTYIDEDKKKIKNYYDEIHKPIEESHIPEINNRKENDSLTNSRNLKYNDNNQKAELDSDNSTILICAKCKQSKSVDEFYKSKKNKRDYSKWCKDCLAKHRGR